MKKSEGFSTDRLLDGNVTIKQSLSGYRFSLDSLLLYHFIDCKNRENRILELGAGSGIISILLAKLNKQRCVGIEIQKSLYDLSIENGEINNVTDRTEFIFGDLREVLKEKNFEKFEYIVSNPPFRKVLSGRINPNEERAIARHEIKIRIKELLELSFKNLKETGMLYLIYPALDFNRFISEMAETGFILETLRFVHSNINSPAKLVLMKLSKGVKKNLKCDSPLIIYESNGQYTPELKKLLVK